MNYDGHEYNAQVLETLGEDNVRFVMLRTFFNEKLHAEDAESDCGMTAYASVMDWEIQNNENRLHDVLRVKERQLQHQIDSSVELAEDGWVETTSDQ